MTTIFVEIKYVDKNKQEKSIIVPVEECETTEGAVVQLINQILQLSDVDYVKDIFYLEYEECN